MQSVIYFIKEEGVTIEKEDYKGYYDSVLLVIVASICAIGVAAESFTFKNFGTSAQGSNSFTLTTSVKGIHSHKHTVLSVYNGKDVSTGKISQQARFLCIEEVRPLVLLWEPRVIISTLI